MCNHLQANYASGCRTDIFIQSGELGRLGDRLRDCGVNGRILLVTDDAVAKKWLEKTLLATRTAGYSTEYLRIELGEARKTLASAQEIYNWLAEMRAERNDVILALGGGVCGDLVGFVAATWLRGTVFVNLPTTVTAMVDASIGGKTGVNIPQGKNLVGAFHQARLVVSDVDLLDELPRRERNAGWVEAIKHGLILDAQLADKFAEQASNIVDGDLDLIARMIMRSVAIKVGVVTADERESGRRVLLNYGHTVGHALESLTGYETYLHGEAVAIGMAVAGRIANKLGMLSETELEAQNQLLTAFGLPVRAQRHDPQALMKRMENDKKVSGGSVRWVLLKRIGEATVRQQVPQTVVLEALQAVVA